MLDFAIDLCERFFAAHGQHGMAQANEDREDSGKMGEMQSIEPAHGVRLELQVFRMRYRGQRGMAEPDRVDAPGDENHDHDSRDLHDAHGLLAGFVDALDVVPPEINGDENSE